MRPGTQSLRPGTQSLRPSTQTQFRPGSQSVARPGTNSGRIGTPGGSKLPANVGNRVVLSEGLSGITPTTSGPARTIADRNYFVAQLRARITELNSELGRMNEEIDSYEKENQTSFQNERK